MPLRSESSCSAPQRSSGLLSQRMAFGLSGHKMVSAKERVSPLVSIHSLNLIPKDLRLDSFSVGDVTPLFRIHLELE